MGLTLLHDYPVGSDLGVGLHIKLIAAAYCTGTSAMSRGWGCPEEGHSLFFPSVLVAGHHDSALV